MGLGWLMPLQGMNYPMIMGMGPHMTTGKPASDGYHAAMEAGDFRLANMYKVQSLKYNEEMKAKWINEQIEKQNLALSDPRETVTRWIEDNAFANQGKAQLDSIYNQIKVKEWTPEAYRMGSQIGDLGYHEIFQNDSTKANLNTFHTYQPAYPNMINKPITPDVNFYNQYLTPTDMNFLLNEARTNPPLTPLQMQFGEGGAGWGGLLNSFFGGDNTKVAP